jgi:tyrosine-protein kinase Etk/Wzc
MINNYNSDSIHSIKQDVVEDDVIDLKRIFNKVIQSWSLYLVSIIVCVVLAYVYGLFSSSSWHISSKILVKDDKGSAQGVLGGSISGDVGSIFNVKSSADNEIQLLKSRTLMQNTVRGMQLNVRTYVKEGFKSREIFNESPFVVGISYKADTLTFRKYDVEILSNDEFTITNSDENIKKNARFSAPVNLPQYNLVIRKIAGIKIGTKYMIAIGAQDAAVDEFLRDFTASLSDKQATTIDLGLTYPNPAKGEAILNRLMQLYLQSNLQNDKIIADSTIAFIDSRIALVSKELNNIEKKFEEYKTQNNIANINEQSKALVTSASEYYDRLAQQESQLTIINDIERYLNNPKNKNVIPSSLVNPGDQSFGQAINSYNQLLLSRDKATLSYTENNPIIENIDKQLSNSRINLLQNLQTYKKSLQTGRTQLQKNNNQFTGQLKQIPVKERNYLDFARQQNLKQELFIFLLQKREETAIARNSTISSARIVDMAKSDYMPFKPKKSFMYLIGAILGVILPSIFLFVKEFLNVRIDTRDDVVRATPVPILGEIGHNSDKNSLVTGINSRSVISEQFRSLRTNLQFVLDSSKSNVILFTSSMSGEGKSFLSLNLGSALALTNKKVVFMEMDLRKPKLSESIGLSNENGFTNYAISDDRDFDFEKLLKPLSFNKNCYLISAGPIPPNPAELLINGKLDKLISYLKGKFDYIIIDCAPVGLVTDALMIERHADLTFYVTRQKFTYKSQLEILNDLVKTNKVKNVYLVVNDIKAGKAGYSGYRQAYGYGIEEINDNWWSALKFWKRK